MSPDPSTSNDDPITTHIYTQLQSPLTHYIVQDEERSEGMDEKDRDREPSLIRLHSNSNSSSNSHSTSMAPLPSISQPQPQPRRSPSYHQHLTALTLTPLYPASSLSPAQLQQWYTSLATRYAPVMMLHQYEEYHPCSVEWYLANAEMWWGNMKLAECGEVNESFLLNETELLHRRSTHQIDRNLRPVPLKYNLRVRKHARSGFTNPNDAPIYCKIRDCDRFWELIYVFHYAYNGPYRIFGQLVGDHDCDFEHVTIRVSKRRGCLCHVYLGSHGYLDGIWKQPHELEMVNADKCRLYIAKGSHAVYDRPGTRYLRLCGCANDRTGHRQHCIEWSPSQIIVLEHPQTNVEDRPVGTRWLHYTGKWCNDGITTISQQSWWFGEPVTSNSTARRICFSFIPPLCCLVPEYWCLKHAHFEYDSDEDATEQEHVFADEATDETDTRTEQPTNKRMSSIDQLISQRE